ncbi:hypothetical protein [Citrobacter phage Tr1]|nr:hypothetical protein [Citrobacter phage Tr1]
MCLRFKASVRLCKTFYSNPVHRLISDTEKPPESL